MKRIAPTALTALSLALSACGGDSAETPAPAGDDPAGNAPAATETPSTETSPPDTGNYGY